MIRTSNAFGPRRLRAGAFALFCGFLALVAPGLARATAVTFRYQPVIGGVSTVSVAGGFNGWNVTANPMKDDDKDGVWEATIEIAPGKVPYKYVVNGGTWIMDDSAPEFVDDGYGGKNSVVVVADKPLTVGTGAAGAAAGGAAKKAPAAVGQRQVAFRFKPGHPVQSLCVAGEFNDWTIGKTPMTDPDGDGEYTATLLLSPGSYMYKFVVDGGTWTQDKAGQDGEKDDGFGGKNSIRNVDDRYKSVDVKKGDGDVFLDGIQHTQGANEINNMGGGRVQFTARAHIGDVEGVSLVVFKDGQASETPLKLANRDKAYEYYRGEATLSGPGLTYVFKYTDGGKAIYLNAHGLAGSPDADRFAWDDAKFPAFVTPDWVKNGVIYQIFPDRFRNGNPANDQDFKEWYYEGRRTAPAPGTKLNTDFQEYYHKVADWKDYKALMQCPWTNDGRDWMAFYGGDIAGVAQSLDYLKELGVTIIYFNPIFEAKSTHKYDGADYMKVDPHFGTNDEFKAFVAAAHAKGIRIILDIVYNHSGNAHSAFRDAVLKGPASPYYNWYEFKKWPLPQGWPVYQQPWKPADYYYCWWGYGDLPDLNFDLAANNDQEKNEKDLKQAQPNMPLVNHLLDATQFWLKDMDCDGVRLDVPNEVPFWFWGLFNQRVKSVKPDAYIVGELWGNASDYVRPGIYDAVMNYAFFRDPVTKFLGQGQGSAEEFDNTLATGRLTYPSQSVEVQMNLIDSHDTVRFLTTVGGDVNRLKLAALFGMTYVGAPTIYYGDEIGMAGDKDPDCRRPMIWDWAQDPQRVGIRDWYKSLTALRNGHRALRTGDFTTVFAQGMGYAYTRSADGETFLVALNAGRQPLDITVDTAPWGGKATAVDALGGATENWTGTAKLTLPPETGRVYRLQ